MVEEKKKEGILVRGLWIVLHVVGVVIIIGAAIVCIWQLIVAPFLGQKLLAASVLVPIGLGVFNMWKYFNSTKNFDKFLKLKEDEIAKMDKQIAQKDTELAKKDVEIETLKEANKLNKIEICVLKEANKLAEEQLDIKKAQKKREDTTIPF